MYQVDTHIGILFALLGIISILTWTDIGIVFGIILLIIASKVEYILEFETEEDYDRFIFTLGQIS